MESAAWEALIQRVRDQKLPSAIILHGQDLSNLSARAYEYASLIIKETLPEAAYKLANKLHPDIHECSPQGKGRLHTIETPRAIRKDIWIHPYESPYKIYIIYEADRITLDAISAFLKLLEDPPQYGMFILVSALPQRLPPTIRSRCVSFHIPMEEKTLVSKKDIAFLIGLAQGKESVTRIGSQVKGTADEDKQVLRDKTKAMLTVLLQLFRDRFLLAKKVPVSLLAYPDLLNEIKTMPVYPLEEVLSIITRAVQALDSYSSAPSCLEWICLQLWSFKNRQQMAIRNRRRS
ncbi:DNA polymerase III subunit delta' [Chlamydia trachomatis D/SotonD1]|uniref:DNA polymerase III subunit delta' n=1 Tax=Chlamydia trachomatis TaxID=813 RepID=UPI0002A844A4|nr:DNA polymerase III subunit delta' [Chlamydia trachomatis]CCP52367.1 DNA polymerase III subunit delta' [Chlamydia trachomatis D/SotonD1]